MHDDLYQQYILEHYRYPHHFGELEDATFQAEGQNPVCGDEITVQVRLAEDGQTIADVAFSGNGCAISQASMSILSDELIGKELDVVAKYDTDFIQELIGIELSPVRLKCAMLGLVVTKVGMHDHSGTELPAGYAGMDEIAWNRPEPTPGA